MCGLVGMAGALEYKDKDVFEDLLHFSEVRGRDSTGFFAVSKDSDEPQVEKVVGPAYFMRETRAYDRLSFSTKRAVIGHTRKATVGAITRRTAHPFNSQHITGVHNGTLRNWRQLPGETLETDSATLFDNFAREGARETIEATDGAYALIWWNENEQALNILRNKERTLYYAFSEKGDKIFWASEGWMLDIALSRNGVKRMNLTPNGAASFTGLVEEDTLWKMQLGRKHGDKPITFLADEEVKGGIKKPVYAAHSPFRREPFHWEKRRDALNDPLPLPPPINKTPPAVTPPLVASSNTSQSSSSTGTKASTSLVKDSPGSRPTLSLVHDSKNAGSEPSTAEKVLIGANGLLLTSDEFANLVDPSCIWCQTPHTFEEMLEGSVIGDWTDEDSYICSECHNYAKKEGVI